MLSRALARWRQPSRWRRWLRAPPTIPITSAPATVPLPGHFVRHWGALTSKPYAFTARPWELKSTESVDVLDGVGSNIRIDTVGSEVKRILPRLNEDVNEEWINDKTRFAYDGLKRQRLTVPMVRVREGGLAGQLMPVDWYKARAVLFHWLARCMRTAYASEESGLFEAHAIIGPYVDVESVAAMRRIFYSVLPEGTAHVHVQEHARTGAPPTDWRYAYCANTTLAGLERADVVLLVGTDPRHEAPLLNTRLRKAVLFGNARVGLIGSGVDLTYNREHVVHLGLGPQTLRNVSEGRHPFCVQLAAAERPALIVGQRALQRQDGALVYQCVERLMQHLPRLMPADGSWNGLNVLHAAANTVGALDLGFDETLRGSRWVDAATTQTPGARPWHRAKLLFLLGADDVDGLEQLPEDCFVVYQGHHGDYGASIADLVLPGAAYTEKNATYVNTEGRVQASEVAYLPPGQAKPDAEILDELLIGLGGSGAVFDPMEDVALLAPHLRSTYGWQAPHVVRDAASGRVHLGPSAGTLRDGGEMYRTPFGPPVDNFYMTDPITRASSTMAKCTRVIRHTNFDEANA
ncbi:hypothetical protein CDCA_CDCA07G2258 [Cyanidium caldarium]|uniref:4Fe-4S Mo/W bis-MGD-type domain-containing protein n=1 Tax=Cyanidium caldarium TaxID=2771 RepID=A0AAV9IVB5_CYACA|nr:hypothetical protein CDCA_CDCA07G2258 [Cyanidium caldarium]